jgi:TrpR-related protein YerC/YecD
MKTRRDAARTQLQREHALYEALLTLKTPTEFRAFFRDLCTPAELQALADRWKAALLLKQGIPYREIHQRTGVSVTTIGRVARCLRDGGGYGLALSRLEETRRG